MRASLLQEVETAACDLGLAWSTQPFISMSCCDSLARRSSAFSPCRLWRCSSGRPPPPAHPHAVCWGCSSSESPGGRTPRVRRELVYLRPYGRDLVHYRLGPGLVPRLLRIGYALAASFLLRLSWSTSYWAFLHSSSSLMTSSMLSWGSPPVGSP